MLLLLDLLSNSCQLLSWHIIVFEHLKWNAFCAQHCSDGVSAKRNIQSYYDSGVIQWRQVPSCL